MDQQNRDRVPVRLRVVNDEGFEKVVLHERGLLRIGSDSSSDLRLSHPAVAPCHLLILRQGRTHAFSDGGSGRGVFVNGEHAISGSLKHGDVITFGEGVPYRMTFLTEGERVTDRQGQNLMTLLEASKAINSSLVLDEVLDKVMDYAMQVTRGAKGFLILADADGKLRPRAARNIPLEALDQAVIPASRTVIRQVMETRKPVFMIGDDGGDAVPTSASMMRLQLKTILCAPIRGREEVIGVIYVDHHNLVANVTDTDLEILQSLADHASVAIENARMSERMLVAERVTAIGRMASSLVHDLRAPLTAIRGAVQLLKVNPSEEKALRTTDLVIGQVDRMTAMTEEVLDFCRGKITLEAGRCRLSSFLSQVMVSIRDPMAGRNIEVVANIEAQASVSLDLRRMERALRNLLDNAADAMPAGGVLAVRSSVEEGRAVVRVADTGHGMTEEARRRAFEPFFTEGKRNGNGLGMAIARKIVDTHGGTIEIERSGKEGTTIRISLPLAAEPASAGAPSLQPEGAAVAGV